jgi:hypothetical protein
MISDEKAADIIIQKLKSKGFELNHIIADIKAIRERKIKRNKRHNRRMEKTVERHDHN